MISLPQILPGLGYFYSDPDMETKLIPTPKLLDIVE